MSLFGEQQNSLDRFMAFIRKNANDCWLWQGRLNHCGYGTFRDGKMWLAHRWAWQFIAGKPLPQELHHECRVRNCSNPKHMSPTDSDKHPDKPSVLNLLKKTCPKGHNYAGKNLYIDALGNRHCRTCRRSAAMRSYFKHWEKARRQQANYYKKNKKADSCKESAV
jgi:hypothetical protein